MGREWGRYKEKKVIHNIHTTDWDYEREAFRMIFVSTTEPVSRQFLLSQQSQGFITKWDRILKKYILNKIFSIMQLCKNTHFSLALARTTLKMIQRNWCLKILNSRPTEVTT